jgi:hypothetical protein
MKFPFAWLRRFLESAASGVMPRLELAPIRVDRTALLTCARQSIYRSPLTPQSLPVDGEFVFMQPLAFGINRDNVSASGRI